MKVFISADMEGAFGITTFHQVSASNSEFQTYRKVWIDDLNALASGAFEAGATEVLVNESHEGMNYIHPDLIDPRITYISGRLKALNQMEGLDKSFATAFLFAHAKAGSDGILAHSYIPPDIFEMKLNGQPIGEMGLNAAVAGLMDVPIGLVIGDDYTKIEAEELIPGVDTVVTKNHITQFTAYNYPKQQIREQLKEKAYQAVKNIKKAYYRPQGPYTLEVTFIYPVMKELVSYIPNMKVTGPRTVEYSCDDYFELTKIRILIVNLTKMIGLQVRV